MYLVKSTNYEFPHYVVILHPSLTSSLLRWPALIYNLRQCSSLVLPHQRSRHEHVWNQTFSSVFRVILNVTLSCLYSAYLLRITVFREGHCTSNHKRTRTCFCLMFYKSTVRTERTLPPGHHTTVNELQHTCENQQCINVGNFFMTSVSVRRLRYDASAAVRFFCCSGRRFLLQR
jgi:hypothetical protein